MEERSRMLTLAIDQSTQGTKAIVYDEAGRQISYAYKTHRQIILNNGWVEHDPEEIIERVCEAAAEAYELAGDRRGEIDRIGICNQRETVLVWDVRTGRPVYNAVVWQCSRAEKICSAIPADVHDYILRKSGMKLSPYFSAAKIRWILDNASYDDRAALRCGTIDAWLLYKLTGNHMTDVSNASRTQLMDIETLSWDDGLLDIFGIDREMMPGIMPSDSRFGETDMNGRLPVRLPVCAVMGDSSAALYGHGAVNEGQTKCTFGTGSSIAVNAGDSVPGVDERINVSVGWREKDRTAYIIESNLNYTGAIISWLKDDVKLIDKASECSELASSASEDDTAYLVPAFTGLATPYWVPEAKAALVGMTRLTGRCEIVKAAEQAIGLQISDSLDVINDAFGITTEDIYADGGPTGDRYLMQFLSDILDIPVHAGMTKELSAWGAAAMAMGVHCKEETVEYASAMSPERRDMIKTGWHEALEMVTGRRRS